MKTMKFRLMMACARLGITILFRMTFLQALGYTMFFAGMFFVCCIEDTPTHPAEVTDVLLPMASIFAGGVIIKTTCAE